MKRILNSCCYIVISCTFLTSAHAQVGSITTASPSCSLTISSCDGDTLVLTPQNQVNYANYKWYFSTVAPANEITAANASSNNIVATNFTGSFPTIKVVAGGTYILTSEYATPSGCAAINDTFHLNFTPRPDANNATLTLCETTTGSGTANFTLTNADTTITGGAIGVVVTYYTTLADAQDNTNPLSSPYTSIAKTIYARVENTTTGCYRTATLILNVNPKPVIADSSTTICNGVTVDLTSLVASYATYSNPVWALTTAGGTTVSTPTAVTPSVTTTYVLVAENSSGCKDTANVVVTVNPLPDFTLTKPVACPGTSEDVNITNLINATAAISQLKLDAGTYSLYPNPAVITGLLVGNHTFTVKNENGCESTKNITISPVPARVCLPVTVTRIVGTN